MKTGRGSRCCWPLMFVLALCCAGARCGAQENGPLVVTKGKSTLKCWMQSSLQRVYPRSPVGQNATLTLPAARNQRVSFQICLNNASTTPLDVDCAVSDPKDLKVLVRRVGYVTMTYLTPNTELGELEGQNYLPGLVPDPLYPSLKARIGSSANQAYWVTVNVPKDVPPGPRELGFRVSFPGLKKTVDLKARIDVRPLTIQPRHDFPVTHWWYGVEIFEWYKVEPWSDAWFKLTEAYIRDLVEHGNDTLLIPTVFFRPEIYPRPGQMLIIKRHKGEAGAQYEFDFRHVKRLVELARQCGIAYFEFPHLWTCWDVKHPMTVYENVGDRYEPLFPLDADGFSEEYHGFLKQYLEALHSFLVEEKILDHSFFHLADEPGPKVIGNYERARALLKEIAPWMKVMDALSDFNYGRTGVCDMPVSGINNAQPFIAAKFPHWVYFCCGPRGAYLNRFMDTPLPKIRMAGWLFYRLRARGFLHWGYNYWHRTQSTEMLDPFHDATAGRYGHGDPFVVYPGPAGPIDSIRWEVFAESLQDYALLQSAGISPDDPLLVPLHDYADFPKSEAWLTNAIGQVLARAEKKK